LDDHIFGLSRLGWVDIPRFSLLAWQNEWISIRRRL